MKTSPSNRKVVSWAYEFVLNHIGQDKDNGEIWCDYIQFIKAGKVCSDPTSSMSTHVVLGKHHLGRTTENGCSS